MGIRGTRQKNHFLPRKGGESLASGTNWLGKKGGFLTPAKASLDTTGEERTTKRGEKEDLSFKGGCS